jgi:hypothetical protein
MRTPPSSHRRLVAPALAALAILAPAPVGALAQGQVELPANNLNPIVGLTGVAAPENLPAQHNPEPALEPTPAAHCGPGSRPLAGEQGRVPPAALDSPEAARGWTCNLAPVGHLQIGGGWKVWRYVDAAGRECAYHDSSDPHPLAIGAVGLPQTGVAVIDMSDPADPKLTEVLHDLPMQSPHESLTLNPRRGLLIAEMGSGLTAPGLMSIYDVSQDCRHPVLRSTTLPARFGHEGGFSPDGNTYWMAGGVGLAAIDVTDPAHPRKLWEGALYAHGLTVSGDGTRVYLADPINAHFVVLDVSEVQARKADPEVREVSRLAWGSTSIPQSTSPMTIDGHPYVLEFDEFAYRFTAVPQDASRVGAARIIAMADERKPRVVSNMRLAVNQHDRYQATLTDTLPLAPLLGYSAHYCAVPREVDPQIVACSFIASGLRIFDIRDPLRPKEVAYNVAPPRPGAVTNEDKRNAAMSKPAFAPERREVWYTDVHNGFHVVRLDPSVWPDPVERTPAPAAPACVRRRSVVIRVPGRPALRSVAVRVGGLRVRVRVARGTVRVPLRRTAARRVTVRVRAVTRRGRVVRFTRRVRTCVPRPAKASGRVVPPRRSSPERAELARRFDLVCSLRLGDIARG